LALLDQGLFSSTNFTLNILLARSLQPSAYGSYAVAFSAFLVIAGFHNALILEPMSFLGTAKYSDRIHEYLVYQLKLHFWLTGVMSGLVLAAAAIVSRDAQIPELANAIFGVGIALPLILLLWTARRIAYVLGRPDMAAAGSAIYLASTIIGFFLVRNRAALNNLSIFLIMGCASVVAAVILLWRALGTASLHSFSGTLYQRDVLTVQWRFGRPLLLTSLLSLGATQAEAFLAASLVGLGAAGALRAIEMFTLPMAQTVTAFSILAAPALSHAFGQGSLDSLKATGRKLGLFLTTIAVIYEVMLIGGCIPLERLVYGERYAAYAWLMPVLGLVPILAAYASGHSLVLKAMQYPQHALYVGMVSSAVALISGVFLTYLWGITGAAISSVLTYLSATATILFFFRKRGPR